MGLTYGVVKHAGVPVANEVIEFYCGTVKKGSDTTDASGNYSLFLAGPMQCWAKRVSNGTTCTPNPIYVLAGTLLCNLTNPDGAGEQACTCECDSLGADADHKLFFYTLKEGAQVKGSPIQGNPPAGWGAQWAVCEGKYHCKGRRHQPETPVDKDAADVIVVIEGPADALQTTANGLVKDWLVAFDPGA